MICQEVANAMYEWMEAWESKDEQKVRLYLRGFDIELINGLYVGEDVETPRWTEAMYEPLRQILSAARGE